MTENGSLSIEERYKKKSQREHILLRPGMYIGEIFDKIEETWVVETNASGNDKMVNKGIRYNPGILKLFDEIILNALDHYQETKAVTKINIVVDKSSGLISVYNDGPGIPVVKHKEHNVYIPEMIFSQFLTSTNYDDTKERLKAGLNGYGAKITSTFSKLFQVETVCDNMLYQQNFLENLSIIEPPVIKKLKSKDYTKITFFPDCKRFKIKGFSDHLVDVLKSRTYDLAGFAEKVKVSFNETVININSFSDYVDLFLPEPLRKEKVVVEQDRWKVAICSSPFESFTQVSFVNGIHTTNGGNHVKHVIDPIIKKVIDKYQKKSKETVIKPSFLRDNMFVVVLAYISKPSFPSQAKEMLTTPISKFGSSFTLPENFYKNIEKMDMIKRMMEYVKFKENKILSTNDGKKKSKLSGIPKLDDADDAGTSKSHLCTLILTEGDSAKTFAVSGLKPEDRRRFGIFPLRGKLLNVRDATKTKISNNAEICNLKLILGLQNKVFKSLEDLKKTMRYGHILILTDSDVDGFHIKGLLINFFHFFWPHLVIEDKFITCLRTPVVKATKGKSVLSFYTVPEYTRWKESSSGAWKIKYYKGLGTSSAKEAKECFKEIDTKRLYYQAPKKEDQDKIILAFQKDKSDNRKDWIKDKTGTEVYLDTDAKCVSVSEFVDKELILFSIEDCERSIPNIMDGFKPSQRKVYYGSVLKNTREEMKVDQLRGFVSEKTAYHHGDTSLNETIININHDYIGSNNINFLIPCGQFGSRLMGGKDAASPRYISTKINPLSSLIFKEEDNFLTDYLYEDGYKIEPKYYYPVIPTVLVNGSSGIGTGYATDIPKFSPFEIIKHIKGLIANEAYGIPEMKPWYRDFQGTVDKNTKTGKWFTRGVWKRSNRQTLQILELPIGVWTDDYKIFLEDLMEKKPELNITDVRDYKTHNTIHFEIVANPLSINEWIENETIEKIFKLTKPVSSNYVLFDENRKIKVYNGPEQILFEFYNIRKGFYTQRYKHILETYEESVKNINAKVLFIERIISGEIKVFREKKQIIIEQLKTQKFTSVNGNYDHLLNIKIHQFTEEQIDKLKGELMEIENHLNEHKSKTPMKLWEDDLDKIKKELIKFYKISN